MSIFKDTFRPYVRDQLAVREELIDLGNTNDQGIRSIRRNPHSVVLPSGNEVNFSSDVFYNYTLSKQCVIRMTSLVDYVSDVNLEIGGYGRPGDAGFERLKGASLSQNFILEGGVLSDFARNINGEKVVKRVTTPRESFPKPGLKTNLGYGDFGIGADADPDGFGIVPMPGIINADVRTKSAYGSLREAKINFECHNRRQLEVLEMLYMRPGYNVLVEWGWAPYITNRGKMQSNLRLVEDKLKINGTDESLIYTNNVTQQMVFNAINDLKEEASGNYDGFLGFIKNFGFQAREDGGYSCYTELVSIGEVLESIKAPNISKLNPLIQTVPGVNDKEGNSEVKIESAVRTGDKQTSNTGNNFTATANSSTEITYVTEDKFNEALEKEIFPTYGGLEGLTKALKNYATFNSFTLANIFDGTQGRGTNYTFISDNQSKLFGDTLEEIYPEYNYATDEINEEDEDIRSEAEARFQTLETVAGKIPSSTFLRDLLRFQAETIQATLIKKLNLTSAEELRNYIIPRGGIISKNTTTSTGKKYREGKIGQFRNDQPFIRWDALAILINEALITKNETLKNPINIVTDRIYDLDKNTSRFDPLKFTSITSYNEETGNRNIIDFSTDPNTCILPVQFSKVGETRIDTTLGYLPDLNMIPLNYIKAVYEKNSARRIIYENELITNDTILVKQDKNRRIGSIYLNINMIDNIATTNADNPDYTVGNFVNDIWAEVNKACPNHNFVLTDDKESNTIFIIDLPVSKDEVPLDLHTFIPFSNKNILRKFEYTSNVPSALASTIAIQAQDPRSIQDIDGVTFAAFNRSIKNRLFSTDITSTWTKTSNDIKSKVSELKAKRKKLRKPLQQYQIQFFDNLSAEANNRKIKGGNIAGILKEFQQQETYIAEALNIDSSFTSVIPLEFSATLDGISGIVIGNMFKVKKDRLPKAYANANIGFIVFNEEQKITAGGDWTTDISGKMTILPNPVRTKSEIIFGEPPPEDNEEVKVSKEAVAITEAQLNEISIVTITPISPTQFVLRLENPFNKPLDFTPSLPENITGGFIGSDIYEYTISGITYGFGAGTPVKELLRNIPRVNSIDFTDGSKITLNTLGIEIPQAEANQSQGASVGSASGGSTKQGTPLVIDSVFGSVVITDTDNTKYNLYPQF
jgi:hypothetical protein